MGARFVSSPKMRKIDWSQQNANGRQQKQGVVDIGEIKANRVGWSTESCLGKPEGYLFQWDVEEGEGREGGLWVKLKREVWQQEAEWARVPASPSPP